MVNTVRPNANATPRKPMPKPGKPAARTAAPQPPKVSQNVPKNSATMRRDMSLSMIPLPPATHHKDVASCNVFPGRYSQFASQRSIPASASSPVPIAHRPGPEAANGLRFIRPVCSSPRSAMGARRLFLQSVHFRIGFLFDADQRISSLLIDPDQLVELQLDRPRIAVLCVLDHKDH